MAKPTDIAIPCPSGPEVASTPSVRPCSGCPGVMESHCLKFLISSMLTLYPNICSSEYSSMDACPALRIKRSRLSHFGFLGLCFKYLDHSVYAIGALPIGRPGCPLFAFWIASADKTRIVLIASLSTLLIEIKPSCEFDKSLDVWEISPILNSTDLL